ncbi:PREDICTED: myb family transcription factor EFM-like isoform X2 [Nelumbo nucifera]|uniref:HTH myb-type domain-containing protein n=2 Tax=Nelumbo nucifera TaxID=4432 RepID=A0A822YS06_NELNU|nr:PREDICTED: myb family transcription factor EFM-like isoform X2 [Nelumbo nucifera]DAD35290.1 TPA_asm: hypothetical protein HUJ06_005930 [Nelumbo nucifera]
MNPQPTMTIMANYTENAHKCQTYMEALEEERRKIQVFRRELPLCLELVTQAIETCRQQLATTTEYFPGQSECSEETSSEAPVLEEFIPLKRCFSSEEDEESNKPKNEDINEKPGKKADWLKSVQLWNQDPDPSLNQDLSRKPSVIESKKGGGAFHPFQRDDKLTAPSITVIPSSAQTTAAISSTADTINGDNRGEDKSQSNRKPRRCWSPELHRRFLHALQQLGGSHAATPKQIRELMKVDGLTNDEVKSHLQKYRLHTRRPSPAVQNNGSPQPPQFVVVGGIWVPPHDYAAATETKGELNGVSGVTAHPTIYAPITAPSVPTVRSEQRQKLSPRSPLQAEGRSSCKKDDDTHSNSPSTSSSSRSY